MKPEIYKSLIENRKSIYPKYFDSSKKIPDETIASILESSVWAPTHGLTQPWFYKVFHKKGVIDFFQGMEDVYRKTVNPEVFSEKKIEKFHEKARQISHVVAVCMRRGDNKRIPEIEEIVATGCAIQNIYLGLEPHGIAGYLSTGDICYTQAMKDFLNLHDNEYCLGFFQLGIPLKDIPAKKRSRIPATDKTFWIGD